MAVREIAEFTNLVDNFGKPAPTIRKAIRLLLEQQFVFGNDRGCRDAYECLADSECRPFFESFFELVGYDLLVDSHRRLVAIMPPARGEESELPTMRVDETIAMLLCRARFDEAIQNGDFQNGDAPWHTDALYDAWQAAVGRAPPGKGRMLEIIRQLKARNMISGIVPPAMPEGFAFGVRPSVALAVTGESALFLTERARTRAATAGEDAAGDATDGSGATDNEKGGAEE